MKTAEQKRPPDLRFPKFKGEWVERKSAERFSNSRQKGTDLLPVYSVTQDQGLVPRDTLDRRMNGVAQSKDSLYVAPGWLAYNMMRMWQGAYGIADTECIVSPAYIVLKPTDISDANFFSYHYQRPRSLYLFWAYSYGLTNDRLRLYYKDYAAIPCSAPEVHEQKKIADFLSSVDGRVEGLEKKREMLKDYKKGLMQKLFNQSLRFENGNEPFPDWEEKKLGEVSTFFSGGTPSSTNPVYYNGTIPFIKSGEMTAESTVQFISEEAFKKSATKMVKQGDLLYALYGATSGEAGISKINGAINQAVLCIRSELFNVRYLLAWLRLNKPTIIGRYLQGGQGNLSADIIKSLKVPMPCLEEQRKIADFLFSVDRKIGQVETQVSQSRAFKQGLLQKMFV